jgi:NAD(P) transhydrogenase subunit alpha
MEEIVSGIFVFMLATFLGLEVIRRVSPLLHTPLMSLTNAISAISVVGAIVIAGQHYEPGTPYAALAKVLGVLAVALAFSNVVGGYLITDRMLKMFKKSPKSPKVGTAQSQREGGK